MSTIKIGQNYTITLETNVDLTTASTLRIDCKKPKSKTILQKTASVISTTSARASILAADNDELGDWRFQVYAVISGAIYKGKTYIQKVTGDYL